MSETGHDLRSTFPGHADALHELKLESAHFRRLSGELHKLATEIQSYDLGLRAASDREVENSKKKRLHLLDEIRALIAEIEARACST